MHSVDVFRRRIPACGMHLACLLPLGAESIPMRVITIEDAGGIPLTTGQFVEIGDELDAELRIILEVGERMFRVAPYE